MKIKLDDLKQALATVRQVMPETPLAYSHDLSQLSGAKVFLKLENLQITGSFKSRGALVKLSQLTETQKEAGVIAASAGNHAQGVAYHAAKMGIPATIVMPEGTPFNKVSKTEKYGAKVILEGEGFAQARDFALRTGERDGCTYVNPFDDEHVIAGQATVGLEILEQMGEPIDTVIAPIGGGGLMAGLTAAFHHLSSSSAMVGVQVDAYPSMAQKLFGFGSGHGGATLAEGIAVKVPGEITSDILSSQLKAIDVVAESAIEDAVYYLLERQNIVAEGAGAAGIAAFLTRKEDYKGQTVVIVISGGNVDARILSSVLMRGLMRDGRLVRLRIGLPDQPGSMARLATMISEQKANIIEIYHHRLFYDVPVRMTEVDVVVETLDADHVGRLITHINEKGFPCRKMGSDKASQDY